MNYADLLCPLVTGAVTILRATTKTLRLWLLLYNAQPQATGVRPL
jgi:hypothetical protein